MAATFVPGLTAKYSTESAESSGSLVVAVGAAPKAMWHSSVAMTLTILVLLPTALLIAADESVNAAI